MENILLGNSLTKEFREPYKEDNPVEFKFNTAKGWLLPQVIANDALFNGARWQWWLDSLAVGRFESGIPQIKFAEGGCPLVRSAKKHIEKTIEHLSYGSGHWDAFRNLICWVLWGLGWGEFPKIDEKAHIWLCENFDLSLLQQSPQDYLGNIIMEYKGNGAWNPLSFFPTPEHIVSFMTEMTFGSGGEKGMFSTCLDPACGTGRFMLHMSNKSVFVYGVDIDPMMVNCTIINCYLYAPWAILGIEPKKEPPYYEIPERTSLRAKMLLDILNEIKEDAAKAGSGGNGEGSSGEQVLIETGEAALSLF